MALNNNNNGLTVTASSSDAEPLISAPNQKKNDYSSLVGVDHTGEELDYVSDDVMDDDDEHDKTTVWQTFIHLLKGYIGCGVLSLPWAVSQLGYFYGFCAIVGMAWWSSYNCWTVVRLKRFVEQRVPQEAENNEDDIKSDTGSVASSNITYPDVGEYLYGQTFQSYVAIAICTQQLAICTVFLSFIGENLQAVLLYLGCSGLMTTHVGVITMVLPCAMSLSFIPSLKQLTPVMATGTIVMLIGFAVLGLVVEMNWSDRPTEPIELNSNQMSLAVCAILYSYEGVCLILPIESAMKEPKHFGKVFWTSMSLVAFILGSVACLCVLAFGHVTSGSVTAFLLQAYSDDETMTMWVMVANTAVSLSVLLTYPLQLFPTLELIGPWITNKLSGVTGFDLDADDEIDLEGFEPLPILMEHEQHEYEDPDEHLYESEMDYGSKPDVGGGGGGSGGDGKTETDNIDDAKSDDALDDQSLVSALQSVFPEMTIPGDSPLLRAGLVVGTYLIAVVVPNVQALISLAGALAGSSTALLIPPLLELAWIRYMEKDTATVDTAVAAVTASPLPSRSPAMGRRATTSSNNNWLQCILCNKYFFSKIKNYLLLGFGLLFCGIGTYASLADIIAIYRGK